MSTCPQRHQRHNVFTSDSYEFFFHTLFFLRAALPLLSSFLLFFSDLNTASLLLNKNKHSSLNPRSNCYFTTMTACYALKTEVLAEVSTSQVSNAWPVPQKKSAKIFPHLWLYASISSSRAPSEPIEKPPVTRGTLPTRDQFVNYPPFCLLWVSPEQGRHTPQTPAWWGAEPPIPPRLFNKLRPPFYPLCNRYEVLLICST